MGPRTPRFTETGVPGTLYVVATPIGNLEDLTPRARRILGEVSLIAAEDTRVTRGLLSHCGLHTPLTSYHAHTGAGKSAAILQRLIDGQDVALVSDAGTPGISDPGALLVRAAVEAGVTVLPIPGPSALIAALSASGLDPSRFLFEGFLPRARGEQLRLLKALRPLPHTLVFYEAPGRLVTTLGALREAVGDRPCAVGRELTKKFEEVVRGPLSEVEAHFLQTPPRGECVIVVAGATGPESEEGAPDVEQRLRGLLTSGASVRDAARTVAEETGRPRNELYPLAQSLSETLTRGT
jgi:16S rRNA (cytidine1402-2'-O)-methyltransferase